MISSQHHSFDVFLASRYGVEEAILIHHFQHWVRINAQAGRNQKDGSTWTYQTRKEIQLQFPYWSFDQIRRLCERLVQLNILKTANYNKMKVDKTLWYAFVDEKAFGVDVENSNKFYERQNCPSKGKIASPLPDSLSPDTIKKRIHKEGPKSKGAEKPTANAAGPSADAERIVKFLFEKIRERLPSFKEPNFEKWAREVDLMLRIDKRSVEDALKLIEWSSTHRYWKAGCSSPSSLRNKFDQMTLEMGVEQEKSLVKGNRELALQLKSKFPNRVKDMSFDAKGVTNISNGKDVSFSLPEQEFLKMFKYIFGG